MLAKHISKFNSHKCPVWEAAQGYASPVLTDEDTEAGKSVHCPPVDSGPQTSPEHTGHDSMTKIKKDAVKWFTKLNWFTFLNVGPLFQDYVYSNF